MHNCVKKTPIEIRTQYWRTSGGSFVKKLLNICVVCKKINSRPYRYLAESDLSKYRFNDDHPFIAVDVSLYTCTFVYSFSRFIPRRGCPSLLVSDNRTIFTANEIQSFISDRNIIWKFNIDATQLWGGMWERLIASVKRCAKKVIGLQRLLFIE